MFPSSDSALRSSPLHTQGPECLEERQLAHGSLCPEDREGPGIGSWGLPME